MDARDRVVGEFITCCCVVGTRDTEVAAAATGVSEAETVVWVAVVRAGEVVGVRII
jgi:hypothetical protein